MEQVQPNFQLEPQKTYRVRQLPSHLDSTQATAELLARLVGGVQSAADIEVFSLAYSLNPWDRPPSKEATFTFVDGATPANFNVDDNRRQWVLTTEELGLTRDVIIDTDFLDFTVLNEVPSDSHTHDLIAVHGLGGNPFGSWKDRQSNFMWLRDALPRDLPGVRSILYGYEARLLADESFRDIDDIARSLAIQLNSSGLMHDSPKRLVFVAHSLGGIILKRAIVILANGNDREQETLKSIQSILFFGVPNHGMDIQHLMASVHGEPTESLIEAVAPQSEFLSTLRDQFDGIVKLLSVRLVSVYETITSNVLMRSSSGRWLPFGTREVLVSRSSAVGSRSQRSDNIPINKDHSNMVKFSVNDLDYSTILYYIFDITANTTFEASTAISGSMEGITQTNDEVWQDETARMRNPENHESPYKCHFEKCTQDHPSFESRSKLRAHWQQYHNIDVEDNETFVTEPSEFETEFSYSEPELIDSTTAPVDDEMRVDDGKSESTEGLQESTFSRSDKLSTQPTTLESQTDRETHQFRKPTSELMLKEVEAPFGHGGNLDGESDDISSIGSESRSTLSSAFANRSTSEKAALGLWSSLLSQDDYLASAITDGLQILSKGRLTVNLSRLLKVYREELKLVAVGNLEKATVQLLRGRQGRLWMADRIVSSVQPDTEEERLELEKIVVEMPERMQNVEDWIGNHPSLLAGDVDEDSAPGDVVDDGSEDEFSDEENGRQDPYAANLPNVKKLEDFALGGVPFRKLVLDLRVFLLPKNLRKFSRTLSRVQTEGIWFSSQNDTSITNRLKGYLEDSTGEVWDWWPFEARQKPLGIGKTRVHWKCHCGMNLYRDWDTKHVEVLRAMLDLGAKSRRSSTDDHHLCEDLRVRSESPTGQIRFRLASWFDLTNLVPNFVSIATSGQDTEATKSTAGPVNSNPSPRLDGSGIVSSTSGRRQSQREPSPKPAMSSTKDASINMEPTENKTLTVFFGIQGYRRTLEIAQIDAKTNSMDDVLFLELRKQYKRHKASWIRWLSVWKFSHCDFVKFEKLWPDGVISRWPELPIDDQYEYDPRHPDAELPPIHPHEFEIRLSPCKQPCFFKSLPFHRCPRILGDRAFQRIPKRKSALEIMTDTSEFFWGLEAKHKPRFWMLCIYHIVLVAGPLAFWGWWQKRHPDDIQTALAPIGLLIGALQLFWGTIAVLKMFEENVVKEKRA